MLHPTQLHCQYESHGCVYSSSGQRGFISAESVKSIDHVTLKLRNHESFMLDLVRSMVCKILSN